MTNVLSPYWAVKHRRPSDYKFFQELNPSIVKIMDGGRPDYEWVRDNLPNALLFARDWGLDDNSHSQQKAMLSDPVGTAKRHAQEWRARSVTLGFDPKNTVCMGVNEPWVWEGNNSAVKQTTAYTVAFCDEMARLGLRAAALSLSVGWPRNAGTDMPPKWEEFPGVEDAIRRGNHVLSLHEYWNEQGPSNGWGWYAGRALKCPWDVPIVIGECGMSYAVGRSGIPTPEQGWQKHISDETYAGQLIEYANRMAEDSRVIGVCVYLCDYASAEWWSKDLEPAYDNILRRKGELKPRSTAPYVPPVSPETKPTTTANLNIRTGAGTTFPIVRTSPVGTVLDLVARNAAGDWVKLAEGNWAAAAYVKNVPALPVDGVTPVPGAAIRYPLDSLRVTQIYGVNGANYARFGLAGHNGVDFGCATGTPVKAIADGVVAYVDNDTAGYGKYIRAWHEQLRCHTLYAHLSVQSVVVGQRVTMGQVIALSGNTGNSTGAHLHLEVRLGESSGTYAGGNADMGKSTVDPVGFIEGVLRA